MSQYVAQQLHLNTEKCKRSPHVSTVICLWITPSHSAQQSGQMLQFIGHKQPLVWTDYKNQKAGLHSGLAVI